MKKSKLITLMIFLSLSLFAQEKKYSDKSFAGVIEICKTDGDPNLNPELEMVDPATECVIVRDTVNNITYQYDATLPVGSRWVENDYTPDRYTESNIVVQVCNDTCVFSSIKNAIDSLSLYRYAKGANGIVEITNNSDGSNFVMTDRIGYFNVDLRYIQVRSKGSRKTIEYSPTTLGNQFSPAFNFILGHAPWFSNFVLENNDTTQNPAFGWNLASGFLEDIEVRGFLAGFTIDASDVECYRCRVIGDDSGNLKPYSNPNAYALSTAQGGSEVFFPRFFVDSMYVGVEATSGSDITLSRTQSFDLSITNTLDSGLVVKGAHVAISGNPSIRMEQGVVTLVGNGNPTSNIPFNTFTEKGVVLNPNKTVPFGEYSTAQEPAASSGIRTYWNTDDNEYKVSKDGLTWEPLVLPLVNFPTVKYVSKSTGSNSADGSLTNPYPDPWTAKDNSDPGDYIYIIDGYWTVDTVGSGAEIEKTATDFNLAAPIDLTYYFSPNTGIEVIQNLGGDLNVIPDSSNYFKILGQGDFITNGSEWIDMQEFDQPSTDPRKVIVFEGNKYQGSDFVQLRNNISEITINFKEVRINNNSSYAFYISPNNSASASGYIVDSLNCTINIGNLFADNITTSLFRLQSIYNSNYTINIRNLYISKPRAVDFFFSRGARSISNSNIEFNLGNVIAYNDYIRDSLTFQSYADTLTTTSANANDSTGMLAFVRTTWGSSDRDDDGNSTISFNFENIDSDFPVLGSTGDNTSDAESILYSFNIKQGKFNHNSAAFLLSSVSSCGGGSTDKIFINCDNCNGDSRLFRFGYDSAATQDALGCVSELQITGNYYVNEGEPIIQAHPPENIAGGIDNVLTIKDAYFDNGTTGKQFEGVNYTPSILVQNFHSSNKNEGDFTTILLDEYGLPFLYDGTTIGVGDSIGTGMFTGNFVPNSWSERLQVNGKIVASELSLNRSFSGLRWNTPNNQNTVLQMLNGRRLELIDDTQDPFKFESLQLDFELKTVQFTPDTSGLLLVGVSDGISENFLADRRLTYSFAASTGVQNGGLHQDSIPVIAALRNGQVRHGWYGNFDFLGTPSSFPAYDNQGRLIETKGAILHEASTATAPTPAETNIYLNSDDNEVKISTDDLAWKPLVPKDTVIMQFPLLPYTGNSTDTIASNDVYYFAPIDEAMANRKIVKLEISSTKQVDQDFGFWLYSEDLDAATNTAILPVSPVTFFTLSANTNRASWDTSDAEIPSGGKGDLSLGEMMFVEIINGNVDGAGGIEDYVATEGANGLYITLYFVE